ncbi:hypothetical protein LIN78_15415 [Leeia sp. TBRC 13508]|uniref:Uncharacterized protein n=1 Tax=Leeia speluncae TaxID=2884804 RepID=A0ABS8D9Q6_9NEIS|nr:hypothetical protein [Leeia speluncae]MCB6184936.1 hypothetical protein [Leeia speluncae]
MTKLEQLFTIILAIVIASLGFLCGLVFWGWLLSTFTALDSLHPQTNLPNLLFSDTAKWLMLSASAVATWISAIFTIVQFSKSKPHQLPSFWWLGCLIGLWPAYLLPIHSLPIALSVALYCYSVLFSKRPFNELQASTSTRY